MLEDERRIAALRDQLENELQNAILQLEVHGNRALRLAGNLQVAIPGIPNRSIPSRARVDGRIAMARSRSADESRSG